ncbi:hypothetical protein [Priestia megaterium]|uniref:hypothetical protein n=1 Tax=Priestia megaterium TaxID=1404 RepID=UPI00279543BE|nr:hypothetical protein [Priestia megaterium]
MKKIGIITSLLTLLFCTIVTFNNAEASTNEDEVLANPDPLTSLVDEAEDRLSTISDEKVIDKLDVLAKQKTESEAKLFNSDDLDFSKAYVQEVDSKVYAVQIPIKSTSKLEFVSGVTLTFDKELNLVNTTEVSLEMLDSEHAKVIMFSDGKEVRNEVLEKPDVMPQWSTSYLSNCLASKGISWAVISLVGSACTLGCIASAGAACVWCVMSVTAGSGSVVALCVKKAAQH